MYGNTSSIVETLSTMPVDWCHPKSFNQKICKAIGPIIVSTRCGDYFYSRITQTNRVSMLPGGFIQSGCRNLSYQPSANERYFPLIKPLFLERFNEGTRKLQDFDRVRNWIADHNPDKLAYLGDDDLGQIFIHLSNPRQALTIDVGAMNTSLYRKTTRQVGI